MSYAKNITFTVTCKSNEEYSCTSLSIPLADWPSSYEKIYSFFAAYFSDRRGELDMRVVAPTLVDASFFAGVLENMTTTDYFPSIGWRIFYSTPHRLLRARGWLERTTVVQRNAVAQWTLHPMRFCDLNRIVEHAKLWTSVSGRGE